MSLKAAPHDLAEQPFLGTPRPLPRIMLCHATPDFCGRHWVANTPQQYEQVVAVRNAHEQLCANRSQLTTPYMSRR